VARWKAGKQKRKESIIRYLEEAGNYITAGAEKSMEKERTIGRGGTVVERNERVMTIGKN